jgi:hypothetical protein
MRQADVNSNVFTGRELAPNGDDMGRMSASGVERER